MVWNFFTHLLEIISLTALPEVLWLVIPLFIATIVMLFYFEKYSQEEPGWNTHVTNSLILLFVSISLMRAIYNINGLGTANFLKFPDNFLVSIGLLVFGVILLFLNFEHILPEKWAKNISSPLTVNLFAYSAILWVYSTLPGFIKLLPIFVIFVFLLAVLNIIRIPVKKLFIHIGKIKEKEKIQEIKSSKKDLNTKRSEVEKEEKIVKLKKMEVKKKELQEKKNRKQIINKLKKVEQKIRKVK